MARLHATDPQGRRLVRSSGASGYSALEVKLRPVVVGSGVFPVQGAYDFGGDAARFGDDRGSHIHQGQDITAAEGTPVVAPRAGVIFWKRYQADGGGHYVIVRGDDGRDYVFMHLVGNSILVEEKDRVAAGDRLASVGSSDRTCTSRSGRTAGTPRGPSRSTRAPSSRPGPQAAPSTAVRPSSGDYWGVWDEERRLRQLHA